MLKGVLNGDVTSVHIYGSQSTVNFMIGALACKATEVALVPATVGNITEWGKFSNKGLIRDFDPLLVYET